MLKIKGITLNIQMAK